MEKLVIDPVGMNITNRIAPGTIFVGTIECDGGLIVQGRFDGVVTVTGGPLLLLQEGVMSGTITCNEDAYLLGTIEEREDGTYSDLTSAGTAVLSSTCRARANIIGEALKVYEGAEVEGALITAK